MSVEMQIDVSGILELQRKLTRLDENIRGLVHNALSAEVDGLRALAGTLAPKRTGYLASTVFAERVGEWSFKLGAKALYAFFVEFGTRFMRARRFLSRALELSIAGLIQRINMAVREAVMEASAS